MIDKIWLGDELQSLISSIEKRVKTDLFTSPYFTEKLNEKYKEAMSSMYFHVTKGTDGKLSLYISPNDDTDIGATLDFERELKEWCKVNEKIERNDETSTYTLDLVKGFYGKEEE
tara:strand:- start:2722 stop:3066 length:345 start_codon:yes stop_codon:yes gene_type:complete